MEKSVLSMVRYVILSGLLSLCFLCGCKQSKTLAEAARDDGILLKGNAVDPADLDPHTAMGKPEGEILRAIFEGLVNPDPKDLHPVPGVAMDWKVSEDAMTYTFFLRPDARWSNGDPVTADDFVFSYKRLLSPSLGAPNAALFYMIQGAEAYNKGELTDFDQVGIKAIDEGTLELQLKQPSPYLLAAMLHWSWFPVHSATILKHGNIDQRSTPWTQPENIVSNGAFKLKKWETQKIVEVDKNPYYWDVEKVSLNGVHFLPMDGDTEERAFRTRQLHVTESIPASKLEQYLKNESDEIFQAPALATYAYVFNTNRKPLDDERVRQALNLAIDREALAKHVIGKGRPAAYAFTPPGTMGYTSEATIQEDIEKAQKLLAQAGYPDGKDFPKLALLYNQSDVQRVLAEAIQEMWRKNLGVEIELDSQEWKVYLSERKAKNFDIMRLSWMGDYMEPSAFLGVFKSDSLQNFGSWSHEKYDELLETASKTLDLDKRNMLYQKAESILIDELPVLPIHFYNSAYLLSSDVCGWYPNVMDVHPYQSIRLK